MRDLCYGLLAVSLLAGLLHSCDPHPTLGADHLPQPPDLTAFGTCQNPVTDAQFERCFGLSWDTDLVAFKAFGMGVAPAR